MSVVFSEILFILRKAGIPPLEARSLFVIVEGVREEKSLQMSSDQSDYLVGQLMAAAASPSVFNEVLQN